VLSDAVKPLVSVLMITYNHEKFIRQALEGVFLQKTQFEFEVIIGDDCSTDGTVAICNEFSSRYPEKTRVICREVNLGAKMNFIDVFFRCRGKYIAVCEGDDYWDIQDKLQYQFDFLENNPEYVLVGGYAKKVFEREAYRITHHDPPLLKDFDVSTSYLIYKNPFSTLTVFFRNYLFNSFPAVYMVGTGGDRRLWMLLSCYGKCRYVNKPLGVYRVHSKGLSSRGIRSVTDQRAIILERIEVTWAWAKFLGPRFYLKSLSVIIFYVFKLGQHFFSHFGKTRSKNYE